MAIQQLMLGVGASKKTYVDDVFSTYLHAGNETAKSIVNGVDLTKGGLVWTKNRSHTGHNYFFDTERGATKYIKSNQTNAEGYDNNTLTSFNNNGFSLGVDTSQNENGRTFSTWSFRKAKGFFDVVTYTGNGSTQNISHSLGCVPGLILIKSTTYEDSTYGAWSVYHRNMHTTTPEDYVLRLNTTAARADDTDWNDTKPTASQFSLGTQWEVNKSGESYVAYLFAGGESTAATARSVDFDGSNDYLTVADSSNDLSFGSDCTIEMWIKPDTWGQSHENKSLWSGSASNAYGHGCIHISKTSSGINFRIGNSYSIDSLATYTGDLPPVGQWTHLALVRNNNVGYFYLNGTQVLSFDVPTNKLFNTVNVYIGYSAAGAQAFNGKISNVRFTASAVYTSSFRPPTEPLTNITNTELLCCNNSSVTGSTVTPGTITSSGGPPASTDSPFDDPAAFTFGENKDQNVIKCGSYEGNGNATGPEINLGWEPQWVMVKDIDSVNDWIMWDSMRGIVTGSNDPIIRANLSNAEATDTNHMSLTPTGFKLTSNDGGVNSSNTYIYIAIRRPDGYVGKPAEAGTDVFAMDTGNSSTTIPTFDSGFPLDFALLREPNSSGYFYATARLIEKNYMFTNSSDAESTASTSWTWDSNAGWNKAGYNTDYQSWMWKRHAGFDMVAYTSNDTSGTQIPHSLGKAPEMIWIKNRDSATPWTVGHTGLNGGTNPWTKYIFLSDSAEATASSIWNDTAPTSTHFTLGNYGGVNDTDNFIAMLFASVDGISKCGFYDGSESEQTITTGFQPRFVIIRRASSAQDWYVLDTTRGWASGADQALQLNESAAQDNSYDFGAPTSTGFTLTGNNLRFNNGGDKYIYYAHA